MCERCTHHHRNNTITNRSCTVVYIKIFHTTYCRNHIVSRYFFIFFIISGRGDTRNVRRAWHAKNNSITHVISQSWSVFVYVGCGGSCDDDVFGGFVLFVIAIDLNSYIYIYIYMRYVFILRVIQVGTLSVIINRRWTDDQRRSRPGKFITLTDFIIRRKLSNALFIVAHISCAGRFNIFTAPPSSTRV